MKNDDPILEIQTEIQALGINFEHSLAAVKILLFAILVLGIVALVHFW